MEKVVKTQNNKLRKIYKDNTIFYYLITVLSCIICSSSRIIGFLSPINVAIISLSKNRYSIAGFVASCLTYLITDNFLNGLAYISSMAVIIAFKSFRDDEDNDITLSLISFGVIAVFGVAIDFLTDKTAVEIVFRISSAILCAVTVFFAFVVYKSVVTSRTLAVSEKSCAALGVLFVLLIATLSSVNILSFNLGRIIGITLVLLASTKYRINGGVIIGALTSCGVMLCSPTLALNTVLLATAGMLCGVVTVMGSFFVAVVFMIVNIVGLITIGINLDTTNMLCDALVASVIYLAIPDNLTHRLTQLVGVTNYADFSIPNTATRLDFSSKAISEIKSQLTKITNTVDSRINNPDYSEIVSSNVCRICPDNYKCWTINFERTNKAFEKISDYLKNHGKFEKKEVICDVEWCTFKSTLLSEFTNVYNKTNYDRTLSVKNSNAKDIIIEQLSIMENMLCDLSTDISIEYIPQKQKTILLNRYLSKNSLSGYKACVYCDNDGYYYVEIFFPDSFRFDSLKLCSDISDICECELELPVVIRMKDQNKMTLTHKTPIMLKTELYQSTSSKSDISGDSYEIVDISCVEKAVVLSDGMGTGKQAKLDSMMAINFATRLLRSGFKPATVIRMINSMLSVKGWDESFATLDIALINLKKSKLEIIKAGSAQSYIIRGKDVTRICDNSLPLGILSEAIPDCRSFNVRKGDIFVMMTDGVFSSLQEKIVNYIKENSNVDIKEINSTVSAIISSEKTKNYDDITVIISKIES